MCCLSYYIIGLFGRVLVLEILEHLPYSIIKRVEGVRWLSNVMQTNEGICKDFKLRLQKFMQDFISKYTLFDFFLDKTSSA